MITKQQLLELGWTEEMATSVAAALTESPEVEELRDAMAAAGVDAADSLTTDEFTVIGPPAGSDQFCLIP